MADTFELVNSINTWWVVGKCFLHLHRKVKTLTHYAFLSNFRMADIWYKLSEVSIVFKCPLKKIMKLTFWGLGSAPFRTLDLLSPYKGTVIWPFFTSHRRSITAFLVVFKMARMICFLVGLLQTHLIHSWEVCIGKPYLWSWIPWNHFHWNIYHLT